MPQFNCSLFNLQYKGNIQSHSGRDGGWNKCFTTNEKVHAFVCQDLVTFKQVHAFVCTNWIWDLSSTENFLTYEISSVICKECPWLQTEGEEVTRFLRSIKFSSSSRSNEKAIAKIQQLAGNCYLQAKNVMYQWISILKTQATVNDCLGKSTKDAT